MSPTLIQESQPSPARTRSKTSNSKSIQATTSTLKQQTDPSANNNKTKLAQDALQAQAPQGIHRTRGGVLGMTT